MRTATIVLGVVVGWPTIALAQGSDLEAKELAQSILDRGAALFDARDAAAMANTFVETGQLILIKRESDSDRVEIEVTSGRANIEKGYAGLFKERLPEHKARNTVDSAKFLGANLLLIHGRFSMNRDQGDTIQFVQVRAREGDQWKVVTMQLAPLASQNP